MTVHVFFLGMNLSDGFVAAWRSENVVLVVAKLHDGAGVVGVWWLPVGNLAQLGTVGLKIILHHPLQLMLKKT